MLEAMIFYFLTPPPFQGFLWWICTLNFSGRPIYSLYTVYIQVWTYYKTYWTLSARLTWLKARIIKQMGKYKMSFNYLVICIESYIPENFQKNYAVVSCFEIDKSLLSLLALTPFLIACYRNNRETINTVNCQDVVLLNAGKNTLLSLRTGQGN